MTSITERLNRDEWNPTPGDTLIGVIATVTERCVFTKEGQELWFPVIVVRNEEDGSEWTVDCGRGGLAEPVIAARPKAGQQIGFKFIGPVSRSDGAGTWDKHTVEFEGDTPPEPDWDRMAASRARRGKADSNGPAAASADANDISASGEPPY
jgi:hypothetical protein